ncbi:MAG: hypothetical protein PHR77_04060, partial [Kiritimatiellae bacterium]|nr:hypothetical protein [Kiritimatiellia bacterium]
EQLLAGRRLIHPRDTLQQEVFTRYHNMLSNGMMSPELSRDEAFSEIKKQLLAEKTVIGPSSVKKWILEIPSFCSGKGYEIEKFELKVRFSPVRKGDNPVFGEWRIGTERNFILFKMTTDNNLDGMHQITIPLTQSVMDTVMVQSGEAGNHSNRKMILEYRNGDGEKSRTVVFDRERGIELFIRESGFESNLVRSLLVILCRLALLAALGLTASVLFSFPVATFSAFSVILVSIVTHYFVVMMATDIGSCCEAHSQKSSDHSFWQVTSEKTAKKLDTIFEPVMRLKAVEPFSDGVLVPWEDVGEAVFTMAIIYPGLLGIGGLLLFRRRELALPYT